MTLQTYGGGPFGPGPGPPGNQGGNDPDLPSGEIEFHYGPGGNPPPHYPGGGAAVPVPDDSDSSMELIPDGAYGPSPEDDHPPYPMEVHTEDPRTSRCTRGEATVREPGPNYATAT